jgi:hypothetical protein
VHVRRAWALGRNHVCVAKCMSCVRHELRRQPKQHTNCVHKEAFVQCSSHTMWMCFAMHRCHTTEYEVIRGILLGVSCLLLVLSAINAILIGRLYWHKRKEANPRIRTHTVVAVLTVFGMPTPTITGEAIIYGQSLRGLCAIPAPVGCPVKVNHARWLGGHIISLYIEPCSLLSCHRSGLFLYFLSMFNMWYVRGTHLRKYAVLCWRWVCAWQTACTDTVRQEAFACYAAVIIRNANGH